MMLPVLVHIKVHYVTCSCLFYHTLQGGPKKTGLFLNVNNYLCA